jgi:malonyl CoA-acyl carrier protein transacylase
MKIMVLFNGQGGGHSNIYRLLQQEETGKEYLLQASKILGQDLLDRTISIANPLTCQMLIGVYQIGMFSVLQQMLHGCEITLAGYSLGEIVAFLASVNASVESAISTLQFRTTLMQSIFKENVGAYDLLSIHGPFSLEEIKAICLEFHCEIAIINSSNHFIVGGEIANLQKIISKLSDFRAHLQLLSIMVPSHTSYYKDQSPLFTQFLQNQFPNASLRYPILDALSSERIESSQYEMVLLGKELSCCLNWHKICQLIPEYGYELIIDLGPGATQTALLQEGGTLLHRQEVITIDDFKSIEGLKDYISKHIG